MSTHVEQRPTGPEEQPIDQMLIGPIFLSPQEAQYTEWLAARPARVVAEQIEEQLRLRGVDPESVVLVSSMEAEDLLNRDAEDKKEAQRPNDYTEHLEYPVTEREQEQILGANLVDEGPGYRLYEDEESDGVEEDTGHWDGDEDEDSRDMTDEEFALHLEALHRSVVEERAHRKEAIAEGKLFNVECATLAYLKQFGIQPDDSVYPDASLVISRGLVPDYTGTLFVVNRVLFDQLSQNPIGEIPVSDIHFNSLDDIKRASIFEVSATFVNAREHGMDPREIQFTINELTEAAEAYNTEMAELTAGIAALPPLDPGRILMGVRQRNLVKRIDQVNAEIAAWTQ